MQSRDALTFGPFHLAGRNGPLARDGTEIKLQSKALALLWTLARQPGEVVSKANLFDAVWPRVVVVEGALAFQVNALRQALGDDPKSPRYIATVHRVGFRFVAPVVSKAREGADELRQTSPLVGRETELARLHASFARALAGQRELVFVTGEPGIGKTALIDRFVGALKASHGGLRYGRGLCIEQAGGGENFHPVLEALGNLCRHADGASMIETLRSIAPTWLMQTRGLLNPSELAILQQQSAGVRRERMLLEIAEALEVLSADELVVLVLEDLHWSDAATVEFLAMLGRRPPRGRLLILCTFRPVDAIVADHPVRALKLELCSRGFAREEALGFLAPEDVRAYLAARFARHAASEETVDFVHRRSDGHPLYMIHLADHLEQQAQGRNLEAQVDGDALPPRLSDLIEAQILRLSEFEQGVLETASIEGPEFTAAACATVLNLSPQTVGSACDQLVRQHRFIEDRGLAVWPDGTASGRYGFGHALYAQVLKRRVSAARQARMHRLIAECLVAAFGDRSSEIAAELAAHFEAAALPAQELEFRLLAARRAEAHAARGEASRHARRGLALIEGEAAGSSRTQTELELLLILGSSADVEQGYGNETTRALRERIAALFESAGDDAALYRAQYALYVSYLFEGRTADCIAVSQRASARFRDSGSAAIECLTQAQMATAYFWRGLHTQAQRCLERSAVLDASLGSPLGTSGTASQAIRPVHTTSCSVRWMLGDADQALRYLEEAVEHARSLRSWHLLSGCLVHVMRMRLYRREFDAAIEAARIGIAECERNADAGWAAYARKHELIARAMNGEIETLPAFRQILAAQRDAGARLMLTFDHTLEAEACLRAGLLDEAQAALSSGLAEAERSGNRCWEPELLRLRGELALAEGDAAAEARALVWFRSAMDLAGEQGARVLQLRAALALGAVLGRRGEWRAARDAVEPLLATFTEGWNTPDLEQARSWLTRVPRAGLHS